MLPLRVLSYLVNFGVIFFIGLKTLNSSCFNAGDLNLSLIALIFSVIVELISIRKIS